MPPTADRELISHVYVNPNTGSAFRVTDAATANRLASAGYVRYTGTPIHIGKASNEAIQAAFTLLPPGTIFFNVNGWQQTNTNVWDVGVQYGKDVGTLPTGISSSFNPGARYSGSVGGFVSKTGSGWAPANTALSEKDVSNMGESGPSGEDFLFLKAAFEKGGWPDADRWANKALTLIAQSNNPSALIQAAGAVAGKFGSNPEMGWQIFMAEVQTGSQIFEDTAGDDFGDGGFQFPSFGGGGFGGGGYGSGPTYIPPDRREVEDTVRGMLSNLVGRAEDGRLQKLTDDYMTEHKRAWGEPELGVSPWATIREKIRNADDFKRIHKLRPDYVSEEEWLQLHQRTGISAGMTTGNAEQFAINQAQLGTTAEDSSRAAGTQEFVRGRQTDAFKGRLVAAGKSLFQGVV